MGTSLAYIILFSAGEHITGKSQLIQYRCMQVGTSLAYPVHLYMDNFCRYNIHSVSTYPILVQIQLIYSFKISLIEEIYFSSERNTIMQYERTKYILVEFVNLFVFVSLDDCVSSINSVIIAVSIVLNLLLRLCQVLSRYLRATFSSEGVL